MSETRLNPSISSEQELLRAIAARAKKIADKTEQDGGGPVYSRELLVLAEARAWAKSTNQPHGSTTTVSS